MHPLETYYLNQAVRGLPSAPGIGSISSAPIYLKRGHGIGNFLGTLFHFVRPLLWSVSRTGGKIITDIAKNKSPDFNAEDIISKLVRDTVTESKRYVFGKLRVRGLKRAKRVAPKKQGGKSLTRPVQGNKKGYLLLVLISHIMSAAEVASISNEFDIFAHNPVQTSLLGTIVTAYKPIAPVDQNDLEFLIPADKDHYIRLDIQLNVRCKLVSSSGNNMDVSDNTGVTNNLLHSLFRQYIVVLNGTTIPQSNEHYN